MWIFILLAAAADSVALDSVIAESSLVVVEIPVIVAPGRMTGLDRALYWKTEIIPATHEHRTADVFTHTPYLISNPGYGTCLNAQEAPSVLINHHQIDNPFFGHANLTLLPAQLFEQISLSEIYAGGKTLAVDFQSKINRFERPYSFINVTTLGNDNMYNIDLTRAFNPATGCYLSGLYVNSYVPYDSLYSKTNGYYANFYHNKLMRKRMDLFYVSNNYGSLYSMDLFDVDLVIGNDRHNSCLYFNNSGATISRPLPDTVLKNRASIIGINDRTTIIYKMLEFAVGINASVKSLEGDLYPDDQNTDVDFWQETGGTFDRFLFSFAQGIKGIDLLDSARVHYVPTLSIGARLLDTLFLRYGVSYNIIEPTLAQQYGVYGLPLSSYSINGNPELLNEGILRHQVSLLANDLNICFYSATTGNFIFYQEDSTGFCHPENRRTWSVRGIEDCLVLPLVWNFSIGHAGSYIFSGDSLARLPKMIHNFQLSWTRPTARSRLTLVLKTSYIGERVTFSQKNLQPLNVLSAACTLKFITLSLSAVFDNILNETSEDFLNPGSDFSLSVKWEFWD